jgi:hypothetical protein
MQGLVEGRIVHYVLPENDGVRNSGRHVPAMIVKVWHESGTSNLLLFTDINDLTEQASPTVWRTSIVYSENKEPNTWHWIEQA